MSTKDDFFDALAGIDRQSRRVTTSEEEILQEFRKVTESFAIAEATTELEQRDKAYLAVPADLVLNGSFETDLTSWTEVIDGGITATTARDTSQSKTLFGSLASLKVDITASTGAGDAKRTQLITAAATEVWSFEAWIHATVLTNCKAVLQIEWLDSGSAVLGTVTSEITSITAVLTLTKIENETAPASTVNVRVSLILEATGASAVGTGYYDLARAEQNQSAISDRAKRIIVGEWGVT